MTVALDRADTVAWSTAIAPAGVALLAYGGWLLSRGVANEAVVGVTFGCLTLLRGLPPSIDA